MVASSRELSAVSRQGVPGSHGLCKSQVDDLKELRVTPIQIKLSEHCRMESVMHRGSIFAARLALTIHATTPAGAEGTTEPTLIGVYITFSCSRQSVNWRRGAKSAELNKSILLA